MTNYEAIKRMTMDQLEIFLDHVYLPGMNNALFNGGIGFLFSECWNTDF